MATYTRFQYPTSRYASNTRYATEHRDARPMVALLAIVLLLVSLGALIYLIRMAYFGYEQGYHMSDTLASQPISISAQTSGMHKPTFINRHFIRN